ncbi:MAG: prepilin peptidase [Candidatus Staskawiczbacteria bacterium]
MILNILIGGFVFLTGLCIGSFLNCLIYRLEEEKTLEGRSFCPHCKHTLSWKDLFPVFSFVFLLGKCRYCKKSISWQYPLVEIATALLFLAIFVANSQYTINNAINIIYLFYIFSVLIVIFVYDLKHYLIPDKVLFPAILVTFISIFLPTCNIQHVVFSFLAVLVGSGFFLLIFLLSKGQAMGFGDVKLAILMGLLLGFPNILVALFLAFFFGAIIGLILLFLRKKGLKSEIPFGPFLIAGTFIAIFFGNQIIQWYLNFLRI